MANEILKTTLPNGLRILIEPHDTLRSAAIGITCRAGSRHEQENEGGITHFIEHMLFKGTERRSAKEIAEAIEGRGGILNAFTDKEQTTYYARVLADDVANALDVLCDMMRHSKLDSDEMTKEKGVVLEEISMGEDDPGSHVHEVHFETRWGVHPLGRPIIGTRGSVSSFTDIDLRAYMDRRYLGENLIVSIAGRVDPDEFVRLASEQLIDVPSGGESATLAPPESNLERKLVSDEVEQVHFILGGQGVNMYDEDLYGVAVLDTILGGGMSGRLMQEVREKRGLAYSVGSYHASYTAGGLLNIYGGTGLKTWDEVQSVVRAELDKLVQEGLLAGELERVKRQMAGNMVLGLESMNARMLRMTKNELFHERHIPVEETLAKIDAVTEAQVRELCARLLGPDEMSLTAIGPFAA